MESLGYGQQPYVIYRHRDIARTHLHIVSVRVDESGKKIDHNNELKRAIRICRELERDYGLHPAVEGEEDRIAEKNILRPIDYKASDLKAQVKSTARTLIECYRFQSLSEFDTLAERFNLTVYESRGAVNGKEYRGIMYGARDDSGRQVGVPFKSSRLGKPFGWEALQRKFAKDKTEIKERELLAPTRKAVIRAMQNIGTKEDFAARLREQHIDVVFRTNKSGRIYELPLSTTIQGRWPTVPGWAKTFRRTYFTSCSIIPMPTAKDLFRSCRQKKPLPTGTDPRLCMFRPFRPEKNTSRGTAVAEPTYRNRPDNRSIPNRRVASILG